MSAPGINLYIDCTNGISGDMLCQGLTALSRNKTFVEQQQQLVSDALRHETEHAHHHDHTHGVYGGHDHDHSDGHAHTHAYTHRSFQSLLGLIDQSALDEGVKAVTKKIYQILATAEAEVHGETLETVHFHEVGRPQAIINIVGIAAAFQSLHPEKVYCSKVIDGCGTVRCAHGEIPVPVPAVRALMNRSNLAYGQCEKTMEMVTPTGLAALLGLEPIFMENLPKGTHIIQKEECIGNRQSQTVRAQKGLLVISF